jgi:hypothetical protein
MSIKPPGAGTVNDRYIVTLPGHVDYIREEPDAFYMSPLGTVIDLGIPTGLEPNEGGWVSIPDFGGSWLANGARILNMNINRNGGNQALFSNLIGCQIHDIWVDGHCVTNNQFSGLLYATASTDCDLQGIKTTGEAINNRGSGASAVGGVGGDSFDTGSVILNSYSEADVSAPNGGGRVGGFIGNLRTDSKAQYCYAAGSLSGTGSDVQGFAGLVSSAGGTLNRTPYVEDSFWDTDKSGDDTNPTGIYNQPTGLTTLQFTNIQNFIDAGWDIVPEAEHDGQKATAMWYHDGDQPRLWYEKEVSDPSPSGTITVEGIEGTEPVEGAHVIILEADDEDFTNVSLVTVLTSGADGTYTLPELDFNEEKVYFIAVHYKDEFGNRFSDISKFTNV